MAFPVAGSRLAPVERSTRELPAASVLERYAGRAGLLSAIGVVALQAWAATNSYALRVIGDTPTFLTLIRDMGAHPMQPVSTSFGTAGTESIHASPYLQALGSMWHAVAPAGRYDDPLALGQFVAIVSIPMALFVLGMLWLLTRQLAGKTAAHLSIPVVLMVFGPVHVAFPSDLSINGFLYAGYYPTMFATGLTLAVLVMLRRGSVWWWIAAVPVVALTVTTDPLNGATLAALATVCAARSRRDAIAIPLVLVAGFLLAEAWPVFDVFAAFAAFGLPVPAVLAVAVVAPWAWLGIRPRMRRAGTWLGRRTIGGRAEVVVAVLGALAAAAIAAWGVYTMIHYPTGEPLLAANRLGFYWNDQRYRWLALFAPAVIGIVGMVRLARRGEPVVLLWFAGFYAVGVLGSAGELVGVYVPLYYRFILLCQVPVAIGVAAFLVQRRSRLAATLTGATIVLVLVFKVVTLTGVSKRLTYFGADLPPVWNLASAVPPDAGIVASDPQTSYYFPLVTRNRILTVSPGHADSEHEPDVAKAGYRLMHELYEGSAPVAATALRTLWRKGVRYVVVEKFTTFRPPTLKQFYTGPYTGLIERRDIPAAQRYNTRLSQAGRVVTDSGQLTVFKLDRRRYLAATAHRPGIRPRNVARVRALLAGVPRQAPAGAVRIRRELRRLGVRMVTLSQGWLGSPPRLTAYGAHIGDPISVSVKLAGRYARGGCSGECGSARAAVRFLGLTQLDDGIFTVIRLVVGGRDLPATERAPKPTRSPGAAARTPAAQPPAAVAPAPSPRPPATPQPAVAPPPPAGPDAEPQAPGTPAPQAPAPPPAGEPGPRAPVAPDSSTKPSAPSARPGREPPAG
jgi:hypothetical protein